MRTRIFALLAGLVMALPPHLGICAPSALDSVSNREAVEGLRQALAKGSQYAVDALGRQDGFFANDKVRIALPDSVQTVERVLRQFGMGRHADELVLALNRAAEAAAPEAKVLLLDAVKKMSVRDAKAILGGAQDSATQYFKRATEAQLRERFLPVVEKATANLQLARVYDEYAGKGAQFGLIGKEDAKLDAYVTQKALDGLFLMIAEQEARIRQNPGEAATSILRKVFGALK